MTVDVALGLLAAAPLAVLALVGRVTGGSWLSPGAFFALYWLLALVGPVLLAPQDRVSPLVILWVVGGALAVWLGAGGAGRGGGGPRPRERARRVLRRPLLLGTVGLTALGGVAPVVTLSATSQGLSVFTSLDALVSAAVELTIGRYTETYTAPLWARAALPFVFAAPALGGMLAAFRRRRFDLWVALGALVPAILMTATQTARSATVAAGVVWLSSYFGTRLFLGRTQVFTPKHWAAGVVGVSAVVMLFLAAGIARLGRTDLGFLAEALHDTRGTAVGHATVFSRWFETSAFEPAPPAMGQFTFAGTFEALGIRQRRPGLFTESLVMSDGYETNVYTAFRPLIEDFTLFGALGALVVLGLVGGAAFRGVQAGRLWAIPFFAAFCTTVLYSAITSIWSYNSIVAAFALFAAVCGLLDRRMQHPAPGVAAPPGPSHL